MSLFPKEFLEALKSRADCKDLIELWGGQVRNNVTRCIHPERHKNNDTKPSLMISPQGFKCMAPSCGIIGDCFQLVREKLGIDFNESVMFICAFYNVTPPSLLSSEKTIKEKKKEVAQSKPIVKIKEFGAKKAFRADITTIGPGYLPDEILGIKEQPNYAKFCEDAHVKFLDSPEAQAYMLNRRISLDTCRKCFIGFDNDRIVVPYTINYKIVYYSSRSVKAREFYQPSGTVPCPLGFDNLHDNRIIYVAEGLFDYLTLIENGFAAIGVPGANAWKYSREWNSLLLGNKIMLCFHADNDGYETNKMISEICQGLSIPYEIVDWSITKDKVEVKDLNDWICTGGSIDELFHNEKIYSISDVKKEMNNLIDTRDYNDAIDLAISIIISNLMEGDPVWILLVGPPSIGKTEIIRSIRNAVSTYFINRISPNTLISGFTKSDHSDVITRIVKATSFCVTDFGSFLSFHPQDMQKVMQQLRDIYDGKVHSEYGNGKITDWSGKVGILGGVTPEVERHQTFIGRLGDRFLYYRMAIPESKRVNIAMMALDKESKEDELRNRIRIVTTKFIDSLVLRLKEANEIEIPDDIKQKIAFASDIFSRSRTPVARMHDFEKTIEYKPEYEFVGRSVRAFKVLIKAIAFVRGKQEVDNADYKVIRDICYGSMPSLRLEFLQEAYKAFMENPDQWISTSKFGERIGRDTASARYHLKNLLALGLIEIDTDIKRDHKWKMDGEIVSLIEGAGFFRKGE